MIQKTVTARGNSFENKAADKLNKADAKSPKNPTTT